MTALFDPIVIWPRCFFLNRRRAAQRKAESCDEIAAALEVGDRFYK